jgi:hypothetical protein
MKILTLDLNHVTGWAVYNTQALTPIISGFKTFRVDKSNPDDDFYQRFERWLEGLTYSNTPIATIVVTNIIPVPNQEYKELYSKLLKIVGKFEVQIKECSTKEINSILNTKGALSNEFVFKQAIKDGFKPSHSHQAFAIYIAKLCQLSEI